MPPDRRARSTFARRSSTPFVESLETRELLSIAPLSDGNSLVGFDSTAQVSNVEQAVQEDTNHDQPAGVPGATFSLYATPLNESAVPSTQTQATGSPVSGPYSPQQIRHAYGVDQLASGLNGTGQTIAIVDAYDDPTVASDLAAFDQQFGLPAANFIKATPQGKPSFDGGWSLEISLDVEWAHVIAPGATILLVEAATSSDTDLFSAVDYAVSHGAKQVSMSWGGSEFTGESIFDSHFQKSGVTFLAASGDSGAGLLYPASSPYVTSVGGTTVSLDAAGNRISEVAWSGSGGGVSSAETHPVYQTGFYLSPYRAGPDVSYNADPNSGYYVYNTSGGGGWYGVGGTSASAPQWAGLSALVNQGRASAGERSLGTGLPYGTNQALYALAGGTSYTNPNGDFLDITSGNNGFSTTPGYDLDTGLGSPVANILVPDLINFSNTVPVPPTLASIPNQSMVGGQNTLTLLLNGSDSNPTATLTYSAQAESLLYWLKQTYGLHVIAGGYYTGARGQGEEYLQGTVSANGYSNDTGDYYYYLLPTGDLYEFTPPYNNSALTGQLVAQLGTAVYNDPTLLTNASNSPLTVTLTTSGNNLTIAPSSTYTGTFVVTATVGDGQSIASQSFEVTVTAPPIQTPAGEVVWLDDSAPAGAALGSDGGDSWNWAATNPTPYSGALDLQSSLQAGEHQLYFYGASATLAVPQGGTLFAYVYLDPANPPSEVMLQWNDGSWDHRAYWGADDLPWGTGGTASLYSMGALPATGQWVRLSVPASLVGLDGHTLNGMAFTLYGGRAAWDYAGVDPPTTTTPSPPASDTVWVEDAAPGGAALAGDGGDTWNWAATNPTPYSGALDLQSSVEAGEHQLYFYGASATLAVPQGGTLFAYVYLDPANPPSEVMLQWNDGSWDHRAYWGADDLPWGTGGTASLYSMGALPATGQWVRLSVPASLVGLDGHTLNGMAFTLYGGRAAWDYAGVDPPTTTTPSPPASDTVWVEDAAPGGAALAGDGGDTWNWAATNPTPYSGALDLQSSVEAGEHQLYFYGASATLAVPQGGTLFAYVYLDPANPPSEVMLQWNDGSWDHRAYWGADDLPWGTGGTASLYSMGALPATGQWVRLSVPASLVGLDGHTLNGMAFTLYGGRAAWDYAGVDPPTTTTSAKTGSVNVAAPVVLGTAVSNDPTLLNNVSNIAIPVTLTALGDQPTIDPRVRSARPRWW